MPINILKGIGNITEAKFNKTGISTLRDMLYYFPRSYRDFSKVSYISETNYNAPGLYRVKIISSQPTRKARDNLKITSFEVTDGSGNMVVNIFNRPYLIKKLYEGTIIYIYGKPVLFNKTPHISSPDVYFEAPKVGFYPIYPLSNGLTQSVVHKYIRQALSLVDPPEIYSDAFLKKMDLPNITQALNGIHYPSDLCVAERSKMRIIFDELLVFCKMLELLNNEEKSFNGYKINISDIREKFLSKLSFKPTIGQLNIMDEILNDFAQNMCMNRLIQGDVGSGKTILAFFAMFCMEQNGYQSVLMVPTEVLANQHFISAQQCFDPDETVLLTASVSAKERKEIIDKIKNGKAKIIIGTHALLYMKVKFPRLALLITDEQHRFGVKQRAALTINCDNDIHMLIMSATPIPRSLALVLYGKTDISILKDKPEGRLPVKTFIVKDNKRDAMLSFIKDEVLKGRQVYFVCPLIEDKGDSEENPQSVVNVFQKLTEFYRPIKVALLHGRMKSAEKQSVMQKFANGKTSILVSTTVIEVGVNVPNATIMVIEKPEVFGLAQIHQLRGRIGRGKEQAYCFLLTNEGFNIERFKILCNTDDGFKIAENDLTMRGMGDVFGINQHGESQLKYIDLMRCNDILNSVQNALNILKSDPRLADDNNMITRLAQCILDSKTIEIAMN